MRQKVQRRIGAVSTLALAVVVFLALAVYFVDANHAQADDSSDMRAPLQRLNDHMKKTEGFLVTFDFNEPLVGNEKTWVLNDPKDDSGISSVKLALIIFASNSTPVAQTLEYARPSPT